MPKSSSVVEVDIIQLEQLITQHEMVVVDFWATWCAPCLTFAPIFSLVAAKEPNICFAKMNVGEAPPEVMDSLGIQSIPHIMIFKQGIVVYSESGTIPEKVLEDLVGQTKALDLNP